MVEKILLWIDNGLLHFGIAHYLQSKNYEIFGILDIYDSMKDFFMNQKIVNFKKIWDFYEKTPSIKPDIDYLQKAEAQYGINIWDIAYTDRIFYPEFNQYYKFNSDEILSIIEQEIKFFEKVLAEVKPNFLLMNSSTQHYQDLLNKICKKLNIPVFTLEPLRFGDRCMIVDGTIYDQQFILPTEKKVVNKNKKQIEDFFQNNKPGQFYLIDKTHKNYKINKLEKIKAIFEFITNREVHSHNQYKNYGRTKFNVLTKGTSKIHLIKKKINESFIEKNSLKELPKNTPFVYYPLHLEPERVLLMGAKFYSDQYSVVKNIAKSIPVGYFLLVKEHPIMETLGWRKRSFYERILNLPNVRMIHHNIKTSEIMEKCSLVITIRGTTCLEATYHETPSIVLKPDFGFDSIPSIQIVKNIEELPDYIRKCLKKSASIYDLNSYIDFIEKNSFHFSSELYSYEISNRFHYNVGYIKQIKLDENDLKLFLHDFQDLFTNITQEYIKKITKIP